MLSLLAAVALGAAPPDFDREVAPLLARRCLDCHGAAEPKGGLDLSRKAEVVGPGGPVAAGKPADSRLWERVAGDEMPPKHPLPAAEKELLKRWIESGAAWGTDPIDPLARTTNERAGRDWWALRPVQRPAVPDGVHPVDFFLNRKLREAGLTPNGPAAPRAVVRRLAFDLTGLPPTPEEVAAFEADPSDAAHSKLADKYLASSAYGERWARHWLDVARYGESDGFERNTPRPAAWPYRDWVIAALNADLPYDRFARLQIAGDVLEPNNAAAVAATGFLVAGVHNTVLGASPVMAMTSRQEELEDMVAAVGQGFLGLTVQCARCHDHKFDPVSQVDYYRLAAALGGVTHGERPADPAELAARRAKAEARRTRLREIDDALARLEGSPGPRPLARWAFAADASDSRGGPPAELKGGAKVERGRLILDGKGAFASAPLAADLREKTLEAWVVVTDLDQRGGGVVSVESTGGGGFDSLVFGERQPRKWMAGSEFHRRTRDLSAAPETAGPGELIHVAAAYHPDGRIALYRNGKPYGETWTPAGEGSALQAYTAAKGRVLFGMRHTGGGRPFFRGEIEEARVYDRALDAEEVAASATAGPNLTAGRVPNEKRAEADRLLAERKELLARPAEIGEPAKVFAVVPQVPQAAHVLARGNVEKPKQVVSAGGVAAVPGAADFKLPPNAADADRRAKLAAWVARADNPLFARVAVNRIWHHHFGTGLVDTPSDFGFNGGRASHPELLDWLAAELVSHGWSMKHLHRLIVTSAAYRRSSMKSPAAAAKDADNRLLWRKAPTRLDAEAVRDSMLAASGALNPKPGGPPFHDVTTTFNSGTTYYEPADRSGPEFDRRTVYRFTPRGERNPVLDTFDCPDPSAQTPRRAVTTTPLQALALWNDAFVLRMADALAARAAKDDPADPLGRAYKLTLGRGPTATERSAAAAVAAKHGPAAVARVLFNCNEFVVIE